MFKLEDDEKAREADFLKQRLLSPEAFLSDAVQLISLVSFYQPPAHNRKLFLQDCETLNSHEAEATPSIAAIKTTAKSDAHVSQTLDYLVIYSPHN